MKYPIVLAILAGAFAAAPAFASNDMILRNPDDLSNLAIIDIAGNHNRLVIDQTLAGSGPANALDVGISGNRNGGPEGTSFRGVAARNGLAPGSLTQQGFGNSVRLEVVGDDNLFAIAQLGSRNTVEARVTGYNNQASVYQSGTGNFAYFSQTGMGNIVNVRQISR